MEVAAAPDFAGVPREVIAHPIPPATGSPWPIGAIGMIGGLVAAAGAVGPLVAARRRRQAVPELAAGEAGHGNNARH